MYRRIIIKIIEGIFNKIRTYDSKNYRGAVVELIFCNLQYLNKNTYKIFFSFKNNFFVVFCPLNVQ